MDQHEFFSVGYGVAYTPHVHDTDESDRSMNRFRNPLNFGRYIWMGILLRIAAAGVDDEDFAIS